MKAYPAILDNITEDGRVLNVSGGTAVMKDLDGYRQISRSWTQGWGQGLALAFLAAIVKTEEHNDMNDPMSGSFTLPGEAGIRKADAGACQALGRGRDP